MLLNLSYYLKSLSNFKLSYVFGCTDTELTNGPLVVQVYSQPVFAFAEKWLAEKFPHSRFINKVYTCELPLLPAFQLNMLRLCFRTAYVISTTGIAMIFPYFQPSSGGIGGVEL